MSARSARRRSRRDAVLTCRTVPLPFFALYSLGAAGLTWMLASWRDRRRIRRLREEIRLRGRDKKE